MQSHPHSNRPCQCNQLPTHARVTNDPSRATRASCFSGNARGNSSAWTPQECAHHGRSAKRALAHTHPYAHHPAARVDPPGLLGVGLEVHHQHHHRKEINQSMNQAGDGRGIGGWGKGGGRYIRSGDCAARPDNHLRVRIHLIATTHAVLGCCSRAGLGKTLYAASLPEQLLFSNPSSCCYCQDAVRDKTAIQVGNTNRVPLESRVSDETHASVLVRGSRGRPCAW